MKICTVINTIRRPKALVERAVRAALNQVPGPSSVLLIDQNSEPIVFAADVVADPRFRHQHSVVPSVSEARNSAQIPADSDWIFFCDDDGYQAPDFLSRFYEVLEKKPELEVVAGSILREDTKDFYTARQKLGGNLNRFLGTKLLMGSNFGVRSSVFEAHGRFDSRFGAGTDVGSGEETDFCWECLFAGRKMSYEPSLVVEHIPPFQEDPALAYSKSFRYGVGKSLLIKKWLFEKRKLVVLFEVAEMMIVPLGQIALGLFKGNRPRVSAAFGSLRGRVHGFFVKQLPKREMPPDHLYACGRQLVIEVDRLNDEHYLFNLGFLQGLELACDSIDLIIQNSHWQALAPHLGFKVRPQLISEDSPKSKSKRFRFNQVKTVAKALLFKRSEYDATWIPSAPLPVLMGIYFLHALSSKPLFVVLHGELEKMAQPGLKAKVFRLFLSLPWRRCCHFLVLSDHVIENLRKTGFDKTNFSVLPHPIPETDFEDEEMPPRYVIIGRHKVDENISFLKSKFSEPSERSLTLLGRVDPPDSLPASNSVATWLKRSDIEQGVRNSRAVIIPYGSSTYRFSVSGVLYEALQFLKPVIAFKNDLLEHLAEKGYPIVIQDLHGSTDWLGQLDRDQALRNDLRKKAEAARLAHLPAATSKNLRRILNILSI